MSFIKIVVTSLWALMVFWLSSRYFGVEEKVVAKVFIAYIYWVGAVAVAYILWFLLVWPTRRRKDE